MESVLSQHPQVAKAAVIGLPHARWGEAVTAVVVPTSDSDPPAADDLTAFCRARLAPFETPKSTILVTALPETVGGKVLKYRLRDEHREHYA